MDKKYHILLGGIGDDSHSVGINLLKIGLTESGYLVNNIGIQNKISDFFVHQDNYQIILISSKNGHGGLYLNEFGKDIYKHTQKNKKQIWYIGGHLSIEEDINVVIKRFLGMGFNRVFSNFIKMKKILSILEKDLYLNKINPSSVIKKNRKQIIDSGTNKVSDTKWSFKKLSKVRPNVLRTWKTGLNINSNIIPHLHQNKYQNLNFIQSIKSNNPLIQPRTGVPNINNQINKLKNLEKIGMHVASVQLDASTRVKNYIKAYEGVMVSNEKKTPFLNGFPVPIYGQEGISKIVKSLNIPFQIRGGAPDHRLTYEIALSGGSSAVEGGFLCYLLPYDKETSPSDSLKYWQYVDRLSAYYYENYNIIINREWFGVLTANLIHPTIAIVINIIQTILSAKQGVQSISVGYAEQGNRIQDIAAMEVLRELSVKYLNYFNIYNVELSTVFHQYMAAFPTDIAKAENLIFNSSITAYLAKATRMMMKSPVEAIKIPSTKENELGIKLCKNGFDYAKDLSFNYNQIINEKKQISNEVNIIMKTIIGLGNGDIAKGSIIALGKGIIDIPFSPSRYNRGEVVCLRDISGAIRFANFGKLPFDEKIKEFHLSKIEERKKMERKNTLYDMLEEDLQRISLNDFKSWPLDKNYII